MLTALKFGARLAEITARERDAGIDSPLNGDWLYSQGEPNGLGEGIGFMAQNGPANLLRNAWVLLRGVSCGDLAFLAGRS